MRILTRYLLRQHMAPFLYAVTGLTLLLLLDQVSKRFGSLVGKGLHWTVIAEVFIYSIPFIVAQTMPMAVLIAVLYVFNRLASDHEITAIKAGGIPLIRLLIPLLAAASVVAAGMRVFNDTVLPESNHQLQALMFNINQKKPTFQLREQTINEVLPSRLYVQVAHIDRSKSLLQDLVIYDERDPGRSRTIYADSADMAYDAGRTDLYLTVYDGIMHELNEADPDSFQRTAFRDLTMRVTGVGNELSRDSLSFRSDREMTIAQMKERVRASERELKNARTESLRYTLGVVELLAAGSDPSRRQELELAADAPPADTVGSIPRAAAARVTRPSQPRLQYQTYDARMNNAERQWNIFGVEIHKKSTIPAASIVFVLIGIPIALLYPRAGVALVVGVSLAFFSAYYVALVGGEKISDNRILSPFWAMWAVNVLFGLVGAGLFLRVTRARR